MAELDLSQLLPHRPPFLFVDEVVECTESFVRAKRQFRPDESFFAGHFPGQPIVPGVLLIEAMAQTFACLALKNAPSAQVFLTGVDRARFRHPVLPGDVIEISVQRDETHLGLTRARASVSVRGTKVADAILIAHVASPHPGEND